MIKILITIPCLYGPEHTDKAIASVCKEELLLIDNGAECSVKDVLKKYNKLDNVTIIHNQENMYVNYAWQQAIDYFLEHKEYTHLIIMNSDLIMHNSWDDVLKNRLKQKLSEIPIPVVKEDSNLLFDVDMNITDNIEIPTSGTAGVFIVLNRKQVNIISPIPYNDIKVWFGDNWIYDILRNVGYVTVIPDNLLSFHYISQNIQKVKGISAIIEEDKKNWENIVKPKMLKLINNTNKKYDTK